MQLADTKHPAGPHRLSLEGLLALGFGSLVMGGICAAALAFWVWRFTSTAFDKYEQQDAPIALHASNGVDAWLDVGRHAELFILMSETVRGMQESRPYVSMWQADFANLKTYLAQIRTTAAASDRPVPALVPSLESSLTQYSADFLIIVSQTELLRNPDTGLNTALSLGGQELDQLLEHVSMPELNASLLRLDRVEMEFILTHDESHTAAFSQEVARFRELASTAAESESLSAAISGYQVLFDQYATAQSELDDRKADLMNANARIEVDLKQLEQQALSNSQATLQMLEQGVTGVMWKTAIAALATALAGAGIAWVVSGRIRLATQRLIGFASRVAAGRLDTRLVQVDSGKFGALEVALNTMADRLQESDEISSSQARRLEMSNQRIALLSELTGMLQTAVRSDEAFDIIKRHLAMMQLARGGTLFLFNEARNSLEAVACWGTQQLRGDIAPLACWGFRRGQPYGSMEGAAAVRCKHVEYEEANPLYLCVPLATQAGTLGLVHVHFARDDAELHGEEVRFARRLSEQLGLALANLKLREALHAQSVTDELTGLYNRRFLGEALTRELARAARDQTSVAVLMIDADHFKRYNDTEGHDAGDAALRQLGQVLKSNCRTSDLACRYGGEEFTAVLPATAADGAVAWAARLLELVREMRVSLHGRPLPGLTVSIGIALYPQSGPGTDEVLKQADLALYDAKHAGRDQAILK